MCDLSAASTGEVTVTVTDTGNVTARAPAAAWRQTAWRRWAYPIGAADSKHRHWET